MFKFLDKVNYRGVYILLGFALFAIAMRELVDDWRDRFVASTEEVDAAAAELQRALRELRSAIAQASAPAAEDDGGQP